MCGEHRHFIKDCPNRREFSASALEPTVQPSRQGSTVNTYGRGRGRGQIASPAQTGARRGSQGQ